MTFKEINEKYTAKVTEYIAKGYVINTATMGGSQGEIAHIDLTDGKEIVRVLLEKKSNFGKPDYIELSAGICTDDIKPNQPDRWSSLWNSHLDITYSEKFYKMYDTEDRNEVYGTEEEALAIQHKQCDRYRNRKDRCRKDYSESETAKATAIRYLKRSLGKRRITYPVKIEKRDTQFVISYRGNSYQLH